MKKEAQNGIVSHLYQTIYITDVGVLEADYVLVRLNAQEQRELTTRMEKKQMKEFMNVSIVSISLAQDIFIPWLLRDALFMTDSELICFRRCTRTLCNDALTTALTTSQLNHCTHGRKAVS